MKNRNSRTSQREFKKWSIGRMNRVSKFVRSKWRHITMATDKKEFILNNQRDDN